MRGGEESGSPAGIAVEEFVDGHSSSVSFRLEPLEKVWNEAAALLVKHEEEVGPLRGQGKFSPNVKAYHDAAAKGFFRVYTMRDGGGTLIGYCCLGVTPQLHYSGVVFALEDVLYVERTHRGRWAVRFVKWMDEVLFDDVDAITRHSTDAKPWGRTLERLNYRPMGTTYIRTK